MGRHAKSQTANPLLISAGLILACVLSVPVVNGYAFADTGTSVLWIPGGLVLAAALWQGNRIWPGVLGGLLAAAFLLPPAAGTPLPLRVIVALALAGAGTIAALGSAMLVRRFTFSQQIMGSVKDVVVFIGLAGILIPLVNTLFQTLVLQLAGLGNTSFGLQWWLRWSAEAGGVVVVTPLLVFWLGHGWRVWRMRRLLSSLALVTMLGGSVWLVYQHDPGRIFFNFPIELILLPLIIWIVFALHGYGAALSVAVVTMMATAYTLRGMGPLIVGDPVTDYLVLQVYLAVLVLTAYTLGALLAERKHVQESLQFNETRLNLALNAASDGLWDWDIQAGAIYYSPRWEAMLGYEPGDIPHTFEAWETLVHPDDVIRAKATLDAHIRGDLPHYSVEYRMRTKSGDWIWVLDRGRVVERDAAGRPLRAVGTHVDITSQKALETALRQSQQRSQMLLESLPMRAFVLDEGGHYMEVLSTHRQLLMGDPEDFIGHTLHDHIEPETAEAVFETITRTLETGDLQEMRYALIGPDDPIWFEARVAPLLTPPGEPRKVIWLASEITERRKAEDALRASEARYRSLFTDSPVALWEGDLSSVKAALDALQQQGVADLQFYLNEHPTFVNELIAGIRVIDMNTALLDMFEMSDDSTRSAHLAMMDTEASRIMFVQMLLHFLDGHIAFEDEFVYETPDSEPVFTAIYFRLVPGYADTWARVLVSLVDISETRRMQYALEDTLGQLAQRTEELEKANRALKQDIDVRLRVERAEREQRMLAEALRDTAAALTRTLNFDEVLDAVLNNIGRVVPHTASNVRMIEDGLAVHVRSRGFETYGDAVAAWVRDYSPPVISLTTMRTMYETQQPVVIDDILTDARWTHFEGIEWSLRSYLGVPILWESTVVGFIELVSNTPGFFNHIQARQLEIFADQTAVAMQNAQLYARLSEHAAELEMLNRATSFLFTTLSDAESFGDMSLRIVEAIRNAFGELSCAVYRLSDESDLARVAGQGQFDLPATIAPDVPPIDEVLATESLVWLPEVVSQPGALWHDAVQSVLLLPITASRKLLGLIIVQSEHPAVFTDQDLQTLLAFVQRAGTALDNVLLYEEVRNQAQKLEISVNERTAELRESEARYRGVIETQHDLIVRVDPQGNFTFVNDAYCRKFNKTREELIGKSFTPLVHEDDLPHTLKAMEKLEVPPYRATMEQRAMTAQGWRWLMWEDYAIKDDAGRTIEIQGVGRDITDLKEAEQALRESEARFRRLAENAPDVIYRIQFWPERRFEYISPAVEQITGYSPQEHYTDPDIGRKIQHPDDPSILTAMATWGPEHPNWKHTINRRWVRRDGTIIWTEQRTVPVFDDDGRLLLVEGIARDVTERKRAEALLEKALEREMELNDLKSRFISLVSHEFRTPLAIISLYANTLHKYEDRLSPEKKAEKFTGIEDAIKRMTTLLEDVLTSQRTETGKLDFAPNFVDIRSLLHTVIDEIRTTSERDLTFDLTIDAECDRPYVDAKLLRLIFANLVSNAAKYSPDGGTVRIALRCDAEDLRFEVADSGIGIPAEDQPGLFQVFHRAQNVRDLPGTGLGLSITRQCVERHGGRIAFESEEGIGSRFWVNIPLNASEPYRQDEVD
jgi:PAS domain S-box-containing protein